MSKLFGTDGIRGVANQYPMTCEVALAIGRALGRKYCNQHRKVIIGKDTRLSCYQFEAAIASGVCSSGCDVLLVGPLPTPAVAFLTKDMRADAGIVISASHNSYEFNGIKIFGRDGFKLSRKEEKELEGLMDAADFLDLPTGSKIGKMFKIDDARGRYNAFLKSAFSNDLDLVGLKIAIDCANGAAYRIAPKVLEELGAEVIQFGTHPDGKNINMECGATNTMELQGLVVEKQCDLGIALDGDADRVIMVDEMGQVIDGDLILAIIAQDMFKNSTNKTVVATIMSNMGVDRFISDIGGCLVRTDVGDINVIEEMRKHNFRLGGEQSGHIILADYSTTGDGMIAALKVLSILRKSNQPLSIAVEMKRFHQRLRNVIVSEKKEISESAKRVIKTVEEKLGSDGRVLVRYSGTEPKLRILVEGADRELVEKLAYDIERTIEINNS
jgi:phosphoglucosamine mutase